MANGPRENLLDNAAGFSPAGVEVEVEAFGDRDRLSVLDRGPGIPEAHLEKIFHRSFSFRPQAGGDRHLGLGLAIVQAIVEGYDGSVTASNRPGGCARFDIFLPAAPNV
jgi:signal transduction histidine kinase